MALRKTHATGFTLIELLAVMAIASALLLVGMPFFQTQVQNGRLSGVTSDFVSSLATAKAEAIARSDIVAMCKTTDSATCAVTNDGWEVGWLTFVDLNDDGLVDGAEQILQIHEPFNGILAEGVGTSVDSNADFIRISPTGVTSLAGTLTILFCDNRRPIREWGRGVVVSILGKASILSAVGAGIDFTDTGPDLTCPTS